MKNKTIGEVSTRKEELSDDDKREIKEELIKVWGGK